MIQPDSMADDLSGKPVAIARVGGGALHATSLAGLRPDGQTGYRDNAVPADLEVGKPAADLSDTADAKRWIEELERKIGQQQMDLDFSCGLAPCRGATAREGRFWRDNIFAVIQAELQRQGDHGGIERMCALAGVSRANYYRHWLASKPDREETALRDEVQRLSLVHRKNGYRDGYRLITIQLQRAGWAVNHKRVARIRLEDNLLCVPKKMVRPTTTDGRTIFFGTSGPTSRGIWYRWRPTNFGSPTPLI
jgi:hypothetical protein